MNEVNRLILIKLLEETIGIPIDIISNDYNETPTSLGETNTFHKVVFQVNEEEPDIFAIGVLFTPVSYGLHICRTKRLFIH
jgi:hypothetical protein